MTLESFWVVIGTAAPVFGLAQAVLVGSFWRRSDKALQSFLDAKKDALASDGDARPLDLHDEAERRARFANLAELSLFYLFALPFLSFLAALSYLSGFWQPPAVLGAVLITLAFMGLLWPPAVELRANRAERSTFFKRLGNRAALEEELEDARARQGVTNVSRGSSP